jgi:hypothetical protein
MANRTLVTPRVRQLLKALERGPRTALQLLAESETFNEPYTNLNFLRRNLQKYADARWIRSFPYATTTRGTLNYYKLTREGFRLLHQDDGYPEPTPSYFADIPVSRQEHARSLADVVVHAIVTAHRFGIRLTHACPENQLKLTLGDMTLKPDFQLTLEAPTGQLFKFLLELDNSTEPLDATDPKRESIRRKITFYEAFQEHWLARWRERKEEGFPPRFRVLLLTRSTIRVRDMLAVARTLSRWKNRRLCLAATIQEFLAERDAVRSPIFLDHFGHWQSLVRVHPVEGNVKPPVRLPAGVQTSAFVC